MSWPLLAVLLAAAAPRPLVPAAAAPDASVTGEVVPEPSATTGPAPRSWFAFPALYYLPETGAGLAVAGGRDFHLDGSSRSSTALLVAAYSVRDQGSIDGSADVWLRGGSLVAVRARAVNYPDRFYGVGSASPSSYEEFLRRFVEGSVSAEWATAGGRLRAGPRVAAHAEETRDLEPGGRLATSGLTRIGGWSGLGGGASVTWDTRDNPLWTAHGVFAQAYYLRYLPGTGRNDGFGKGALDLRAFHGLGGGRVLAANAVVETTDGATPFSLLSKLGNVRFLRGYREGRYRDAMVWAAQLELRAPVRGPLAVAAFAGAGDVFPDLGALTLRHPKASGGAGARWRLTPGGADLRVDVAVGREGPEVYVVLLEAF